MQSDLNIGWKQNSNSYLRLVVIGFEDFSEEHLTTLLEMILELNHEAESIFQRLY